MAPASADLIRPPLFFPRVLRRRSPSFHPDFGVLLRTLWLFVRGSSSRRFRVYPPEPWQFGRYGHLTGGGCGRASDGQNPLSNDAISLAKSQQQSVAALVSYLGLGSLLTQASVDTCPQGSKSGNWDFKTDWPSKFISGGLTEALIGDLRRRIQVDLIEFQKLLCCSCCTRGSSGLLPSMHDTSIIIELGTCKRWILFKTSQTVKIQSGWCLKLSPIVIPLGTPQRVDWRETDVLNSVRDQRDCVNVQTPN
ncbi:hypothetical protein V6N13_121090 [Hibiscus sabdariffa]